MTDANTADTGMPSQEKPKPNLARGLRTHYCGELTEAEVGQHVSVCGWVDRRREHGEHLAFVDLRDHTGIIQCAEPKSTVVLELPWSGWGSWKWKRPCS